MTRHLGVDPGLSGAAAVVYVDAGKVVDIIVFDIPTVKVARNKKMKNEYLIPIMAGFIKANGPYDSAVMELVGGLPKQGVSSVFAFGRGVGIWEGILAASGVAYSLAAPTTWKKALAVIKGDGKQASLHRVIQLFPTFCQYFARKKDDGRAEAVLMAWYGYKYQVGLTADEDF